VYGGYGYDRTGRAGDPSSGEKWLLEVLINHKRFVFNKACEIEAFSTGRLAILYKAPVLELSVNADSDSVS
jgi:hypothetical protein